MCYLNLDNNICLILINNKNKVKKFSNNSAHKGWLLVLTKEVNKQCCFRNDTNTFIRETTSTCVFASTSFCFSDTIYFCLFLLRRRPDVWKRSLTFSTQKKREEMDSFWNGRNITDRNSIPWIFALQFAKRKWFEME